MTSKAHSHICQLMLNATGDLLFLVDLEAGSIVETNIAVDKTLGYKHKEIQQLPVSSLFSHYTSDKIDLILEAQSIADLKRTQLTTKMLSKIGLDIPVDILFNPCDIEGKAFMLISARDMTASIKIDIAISSLASMPSNHTDNLFFKESVKNLASIFQMKYGCIGLLNENKTHIVTQAIWAGEVYGQNFEYLLQGSPCEDIIDNRKTIIPINVSGLYPHDEFLSIMQVESYIGMPFVDENNSTIGIVSVMDTKPMQSHSWSLRILGIYAARIAAEYEEKNRRDNTLKQNAKPNLAFDERTTQLRAVNKELESFSYSISHDLRAPLRAITGFADALQDEYKHVFDDTGLDYLKRIIVGGERMGRLIDDLLALSRITRKEIVKADINLSQLAKDSMETLRLKNPDKPATINISPNIMGNGDPGLISVVMANLMNNAWKYSQKSAQVDIVFGMESKNGEVIYYVQDNGEGFKMQYADKIFNAFQRLHSSKEYEGTGIGLATVQRIIHRHGGQIWAKSSPDHGATFYFTLH